MAIRRTVKQQAAGVSLPHLLGILEAEKLERTDAIVETAEHVTLDVTNGKIGMLFMTEEVPELDGQLADITPYAHKQIAARVGIDGRYYDRMLRHQPQLLVKNVDTWWRAEPEHRMVRTLRRAENNGGGWGPTGPLVTRAWLSDRYRTLDNLDFVKQALDTARGYDAQVVSCHLDDERVYVKLTTPRLTGEIAKGDMLQGGVIIKNSEVGDGKVLVQPYCLRLICTNGLVGTEQFGQVHLGGEKDIGVLKQDTLAADAQFVWLQVRDWVAASLSGEFLEKRLQEFHDAKGIKLKKVPARKVVANIVRGLGLTGNDGAHLLESYLRANDDTQFGAVNAITEYAQSAGQTYRGQVDLEIMGGRMLAMEGEAFKHMVTAPLTDEQITKAISPN